jgi:hypothetical protein
MDLPNVIHLVWRSELRHRPLQAPGIRQQGFANVEQGLCLQGWSLESNA